MTTTWLAISGLQSGPLFPAVISNQAQAGKRMDSRVCRRALGEIGSELGIASNVAERSARRGGAGFQRFALRRGLCEICADCGWGDMKEALKCIGIEGQRSSHAQLGLSGRFGFKQSISINAIQMP